MADQEITVAQLEQAAKNIFDLRAEVDQDKNALKAKQEVLDTLEAETLDLLKAAKLDKFVASVGTVGRSARSWVTLPQTLEDKLRLLDWLKANGRYEEYVTVNSNSINSLFQEEWDKVKQYDPEAAMDFRIPGLSEPKLKEQLRFTKAK